MSTTDLDLRTATRSGPGLPAPPPDGGVPRRLGRIWLMLGAAGMLVSAVIGAAVLPVPYVAISPGSVRPVTEQVLVQGVDSYPPAESIAYTTVNVGGTTLLEAFAGWLDDSVDVLPEAARPWRSVRSREPALQRAADGHVEARRHRRGSAPPRP